MQSQTNHTPMPARRDKYRDLLPTSVSAHTYQQMPSTNMTTSFSPTNNKFLAKTFSSLSEPPFFLSVNLPDERLYLSLNFCHRGYALFLPPILSFYRRLASHVSMLRQRRGFSKREISQVNLGTWEMTGRKLFPSVMLSRHIAKQVLRVSLDAGHSVLGNYY